MKKYLLSMFALILAVGFSSFTSENKTSLDTYDWVSASNPMDQIFGKTRNEAIIHYSGCDLGSEICARAFEEGTQTEVSTEDLRFN
jgi:hypothetical protein